MSPPSLSLSLSLSLSVDEAIGGVLNLVVNAFKFIGKAQADVENLDETEWYCG